MGQIIRREKRQRGPIGTIIKWTFIAFNILMIIWIVGGMSSVSDMKVHSSAAQAGKIIGGALGFASLMILWAVGDVILGMLVLLTRGDTILIEEVAGNSPRNFEATSNNFGRADDLIAEFKAKGREQPPETNARSAVAQSGFGRRQ